MMEFTFEGVVRQGFGFYNPNHAAALVCALFPFAWAAWFRWREWWVRCVVALAGVALVAMLACTLSRTGFLVLWGETVALAWIFCRRKWVWVWAVAGLVSLLLAFALHGGWGRLAVDAAVLNRLAIWEAGVRLAAANPLGVGLGHSGELASCFLLPEGVSCRTLVNSHLTLWAEAGWVAGAVWCAAIGYALAGWRLRPVAAVALGGLVVSALCSSVLDWHVLFDWKEFGGLSVLNFSLSWGVAVLFAGLVLALGWGRVRWRAVQLGGAVVFLMMAAVVALPGGMGEGPRVRSGLVVDGRGEGPLVLYDAGWPLARLLPLLPEGYRLPLCPYVDAAGNAGPDAEAMDEALAAERGKGTAGRVWLFGDATQEAAAFPAARLVLVSPPEWLPVPENAGRVLLRRFVEERDDARAEFYDL